MTLVRHRFRGFTLIEVLIGLAIFAMAAIGLAIAYLNVLSGYQSVAHRQEGEEEWKLLRTIILSEPDREKVVAGGQLPLPNNTSLHWSATIESTSVADLFAVTVRSELEAAGNSDARPHEEKILLLRPRWSDPLERNKLRAASQEKLAKQRQQ